MDPTLESPDRSDRAVSAEPSSTRPNPFDDSDVASRKRQRTSVSGSPTTSVDTVNPINESASSIILGTEPVVSTRHTAANARPEPAIRKTPEPRSPLCEPMTEPSSSMVTINLRNASQNEDEPSLPPSPSPISNPINHDAAAEPIAQHAKDNIGDDGEVDMVSVPADGFDALRHYSSSSGSPPVEVIAMQSDEDMISDRRSVGVSLIGDDSILIDPVRDFPYNDPGESLVDTVVRLSNYFSSQSTIEDKIIDTIQQWLEQYLRYVNDVDQQSAADSCRMNCAFWHIFPEIVGYMLCQKPPLSRMANLRKPTMDLYTGFAKLSAWFVTLDLLTIEEHSSSQLTRERRPPGLFSSDYLRQVHALCYPLPSDDAVDNPEMLFADREDASYILQAFQSQAGGSIDCLSQLTKDLVTLVPAFPRLSECLAPICQVSGLIMFDNMCNQSVLQPAVIERTLMVGHELYDLVTDTLTKLIDKNATQLNADNVSSCLRALMDMLKIGLQGDHQAAVDLLQQHAQTWPNLPTRHSIEAIAWERRFDTLVQLIRSNQMQLRVMGVTQMCADLVGCWKRLGEARGGDNAAYLNHLAVYLLRSELVEYILSPSCHPEIIVEGANIIGFLAITRMYQEEHTNLIWQGITSSQDPRVADALTRLATHISNLFDYSGLLGFCQKLQSLPVDGFTPAVRSLWDTILRHMASRAALEEKPLSYHAYELCLRLLQEASACGPGSQIAHPEMQVAAMQKLKELLTYGPDAEGRQQLYSSCIKDIAEKTTATLGSLWGLLMAIRPGLQTEIRFLTENHDLARLVVDELDHAIETGRQFGIETVVFGGVNQPRREFIANIIQLEPQSLIDSLGLRLWGLLVGPRSLSLDDRRAGWSIINNIVRRVHSQNPFLSICLTQYLPNLPPACFCDGMLEFLRQEILPRLAEKGDLFLDDQESVNQSGIEHLWRLILEADDKDLVGSAVRTLAADVYIESPYIQASSLHRVRQIHLAVVDRCLRQLKEAARVIKASSEGATSDDDESMIIVTTGEQALRQERIFTRSLTLLRFFLEFHQSKPQFSTPDLRMLIPSQSCEVPCEVQGDSADLKYQSFDGSHHTEVKPLKIGRENTAASLLASLRHETGFENYRIYYRGRPFLPNEQEICKSLADLQVHDGLILVKREEGGPVPSTRVNPGASPLEVEIAAHFDEIWEYLSMEEPLAQEIYQFLVKLPVDGQLLQSFERDETSYRAVFPPGQPFKSLYSVHALSEYIETAFYGPMDVDGAVDDGHNKATDSPSGPYAKALRKSISLVVQAISDEEVFDGTSVSLRLRLTQVLISTFQRFLHKADSPRGMLSMSELTIPEPDRFIEMAIQAADHPGETSSLPTILTSLAVMLRLGVRDNQFWVKLSTNTALAPLLQRLFLTEPQQPIRSILSKMVDELLTKQYPQVSSGGVDRRLAPIPNHAPLMRYFWTIVCDLVLQTVQWPRQCEEVFRLTHALLPRMMRVCPEAVDVEKLASQLGQLLLAHTSTENIGYGGTEDIFARGATSLLHLCFSFDDSLATSSILPVDLAEQLIWKHLYPPKRDQSQQLVPRALLSSESRAKLCDVVFSLVKHDKQMVHDTLKAIESLVPFYEDDDDDPYLYDLTYQFDRSKALRSASGYVGLQNLSNTCYLNSLLTQLYMNTGFRQCIMQSRVINPANSQQLLFYTQKLFGYMQESYCRFVDPNHFVSSIKTYDDTLIDIHNQMDVDEFYNLLFDRWEGQLLGSEEKKRLKSFYGGQLVQQVKSKECEHISERLEPFSAIQCDIKGKNTLEESLQAYVDGEIMEGDNKYKCSTCDKHVDAIKRACLKDVPDNVIFHLKRFDFNLRTLQRSKINDYFQFPSRIDMRPYTIEHLSAPANDTEEDVFELVGVLVHSGTAESGHYYSYIRERPSPDDNPRWVEFNDDIVTTWDPTLMESSTFGGPDPRSAYDANGIIYDKSYSAYMLFYQRASSLKAEQERMAALGVPAPLKVDIPDVLNEAIMGENTVLLRRHCIYDPNHVRLVQMLFQQAKILCGPPSTADFDKSMGDYLSRRSDDQELKSLAVQTVISHLDQVVTRTKDLPDLLHFTKMIGEAICEDHDYAFSFYDYFNKRRGAFRALVQRNPDAGVRLHCGKLFNLAIQNISISLPQVYDPAGAASPSSEMDEDEIVVRRPNPDHAVIHGALILLNHLWRFFHANLRAWDEHFATILGFAKIGSRETAYVLAADYLNRVLRIISADPMQDLPANYARMMHNVLRRVNSTRPPSYIAIITLANYLMHQLEPELSPETIVDDAIERMDQMEAPFNWTAGEVDILHTSIDDVPSSLLVEKLMGIDQAHSMTDDIVGFLTQTSAVMDSKILLTLKRCIRGDTSAQSMDPYLRVASVYLENTAELDNANSLLQHVCSQVKSLQNTEGLYFVDIFRTALNLARTDGGFETELRSLALRLVPRWVPHLLSFPDESVRACTQGFLEHEVFRYELDEEDQEIQDQMRLVMKQLGIMCLRFMQEHYVRRRIELRRDTAGAFLQVVGQCAKVMDRNSETQDDLDVEFLAAQFEVVDPIRRLIIDEMEEDGSDWEGSRGSSDQLDEVVDMNV